jgi:hypothetical protein
MPWTLATSHRLAARTRFVRPHDCGRTEHLAYGLKPSARSPAMIWYGRERATTRKVYAGGFDDDRSRRQVPLTRLA